MKMKTIVTTALLAFGLVSCVPDYGLTIEDYRTIATLYDTAQDYNKLGSFFLIDSVYHILKDGEKDNISRTYDQRILKAFASQMEARGWTRITDTAGNNIPKTLMRVSVTSSVTVGYYYDYWYGWYGGWYGGWWGYPGGGWYYPPGYWNTYSYTTGSLITELDEIVLPANQGDSINLRPVWIGSSNGLLSSSEGTNVTIITNAISQMFNQSPYLVLSSNQ